MDLAGKACRINDCGDLGMLYEAKAFIGQPCHIVKRTKAGLILVSLDSDPTKTYAFKQKNVDLL